MKISNVMDMLLAEADFLPMAEGWTEKLREFKSHFHNCANALVSKNSIFLGGLDLAFRTLIAESVISNYEEVSRLNRNGCTYVSN